MLGPDEQKQFSNSNCETSSPASRAANAMFVNDVRVGPTRNKILLFKTVIQILDPAF